MRRDIVYVFWYADGVLNKSCFLQSLSNCVNKSLEVRRNENRPSPCAQHPTADHFDGYQSLLLLVPPFLRFQRCLVF